MFKAWISRCSSNCINFCLLALTASGAAAQPQYQLPPQEPRLVIDAEMHIARISRFGVDSKCRLMVTGSNDKTVRLWSLPDGNLIRVLRIPIGDGEDGKALATTLSPDGRLIAVGRATGPLRSSRGGEVYIFDSSSGQIVRTLGRLAQSVNHLAFSPDGQYLAAVLWGGLGLRVWATRNWRLVGEDLNYNGKDAYGAAFDKVGNLFTVADDGRLRRYGRNHMKVPTSVVTQSGKQPYSVAVHPTDGTVAVGFADTTAVEIYDARTLARRPPPHLDAVNNGSLQAISWSGDGQSLYAAGSYPGGGYPSSAPKRIKVWDRAGAGPVREIEVAPRIVINLVPCGDGSAFAALGPSFGLLDRNGALLLWKDSAQADMRGKLASDFTVSADAQRVRFGLKAAGGEPVLFDLQAERLTDSPTAVEGLYSPDLNNFPVTDWTNNNQPKLAGTPIQLELNETARSLAVARKTEQFVLGTEFYLRAYDKKAREIWSREAGVAWGVNVAEDVKLVVAAYGDGTIRWHRLADGQELLVLFVHAKDRRWVAWTPKGYYTASPGGESLIGWHLNRSWNDPADFFPVHRFRARFYRPDVVHQVLSAMDEDIAIAEADKLAKADRQERNIRKLLPPVLEIQSPKDGDRFNKSNVSIQYTVRAPAGEKISEVEVYLDDQKISSRGFIPVAVSSADAKQLDLVLPRRGVKVTLVARSGDKASEPRSVRLTWDGITSDPKPQPRLLALLIGVSAYNQRALRLEYAHQDALNLNAALKTQEGKAFLKVETKVLIDADSASIRKGFDWLNETAHEGDLTLILLSGHGTTRNNTFFFLPAEADPANLSATAISGHEIVGTAQGLPGGKLLLIDACRAGGGLTPIGMTKVPVDMNKLANDMGQPVGAIFFGSSSVGEYSYEDSRLKAGAFTAALIEGLSGKADFNDDGKIETDELGVWLRRRVPQLTEEKQHPLRHQSAPVDYTLANP